MKGTSISQITTFKTETKRGQTVINASIRNIHPVMIYNRLFEIVIAVSAGYQYLSHIMGGIPE